MARVIITTSSFDIEGSAPLEQLQRAGVGVTNNPHRRRLTEAEVSALLEEDVVGMIAGVEPLTRSVLLKAHALKVVSRCGIGLDSVDLEAAAERGIKVYNTPDAPSAAVAELALGLILGLLRQISRVDRDLHRGEWNGHMGGLLSARTVGVVGYGRVGRRVAQLVHAFGSTVIACDAQPVDVPVYIERTSLDDLLRRSDIVTLHAPLIPGGGHLINRSRLAMMKPGAYLVNTARGGLVDEAALLEALQSNHLAGAACDVFEQEPYRGPLAQMPQVMLTAHMGSYASESRMLMEQEAANNLVRGLAECGILDHGTAPKRR